MHSYVYLRAYDCMIHIDTILLHTIVESEWLQVFYDNIAYEWVLLLIRQDDWEWLR